MLSHPNKRDHRRREVSRIRLEMPGATVREVQHELANRGIINPDTDEPWSRATVQRDLEHLRERARELADRDASEWRQEELRKLDQLEERALNEQSIHAVYAVLDIQKRRARLLCLDRETPVGSDGSSSRIDKLIEVIEMIREEDDLSRFDEETWADETEVDLPAEQEAPPIHPRDHASPSESGSTTGSDGGWN